MTCYFLYIFSLALWAKSEAPVHPPDTLLAPQKAPLFTKAGVTLDYGRVVYLLMRNKRRYAGGLSVELKDLIRTECTVGYVWQRTHHKALEGGREIKVQKHTMEGFAGRFALLFRVLKSGGDLMQAGLAYGTVFYSGERTLQQENYAPFYATLDEKAKYQALDRWLALQLNFSTHLWRNFRVGSTLQVKRLLPKPTQQGIPPLFIPGVGDKRLPLYPSLHLFVAFYPYQWRAPTYPEKEKP